MRWLSSANELEPEAAPAQRLSVLAGAPDTSGVASAGGSTRFGILGPVEAIAAGVPIAVGGTRQRALLAVLLLHANEPLNAERIAQALWGEDAPGGAEKTVQVYVSRLRRALGDPELLTTTAAGYTLRVAPGELDSQRFEELVAEGCRALDGGRAQHAGSVLRDALGLWRGPPLAELTSIPFAAAEIVRLEEQRLEALEARVEADLAAGRHTQLVGELQQLSSAHPLRERLCAQLMLALYRSGRQAEALEAFREARERLVADMGIEPDPTLQRLQASILRQDAALDLPARAGRLGADPGAAPLKVPLPRTRTVGRTEELARLRELLDKGRLLTLVGAGGMGKTRLAVELARAVHPDYAYGVRFVSLATTEAPELVPAGLAAAIGVAPLPEEAPLDGLLRLIGDKRMLLVLDNFEHVLAAARVVGELIEACEGLRVLVTSREPLRLMGEQLFVVGPLALPAPEDRLDLASVQGSAAVRLFAERCAAHDPDFVLGKANAASVAEICARVEGMPLAIELAAAHAALLPPSELLRRLDDALSVLVGGPRDAPARQQTLRATLDWGHELLDEEERRAFAGLATFSGGCTLDAAQTVTDIELGAIEALLAKSLILSATQDGGEPRVRMLEPVRAYARERLDERSDAEELRRRHCEYYVSLAERSEAARRGREQLTWLSRLDADHANLRAAVSWSLRTGRPELGLRLASALGNHGGALHAEITGWLEATLKAAANAEPQLQAKGHLALGLVIAGGPAGMEPLREALRFFRAESDAHGAAQALIALSIDADQAGEREQAAELATEALELARTTEDEWLIASALSAQVLGSPESFRETRRFGEEALAMARRRGDRIQLAIALSNFGFAAVAASDYVAAAPVLDESVEVAEQVGDGRVLPFNLVNRGLLRVLKGEDRSAAGDFARTLVLCRESGQPLPVAEALTGIAAITVRRDDMQLAARLSGAADAHRHFHAVGIPELQLRERVIDPARARCSDADWEQAWTTGNSLSFDQAIALGVDAVA